MTTYSYLIKLSNYFCTIYLVFHISQIELASHSDIPNHVNPLPPPIEIDSNLKFKIAQMLNSKLDWHRKGLLLYYVQWSGYKDTPDKYQWILVTNLDNVVELLSKFYSLYPDIQERVMSQVSLGHSHMMGNSYGYVT